MNRGVFLVALHPEVVQAQTEAIFYPVYKVDELRIGSSGFNQERIFSISWGVFVLQRLNGDEPNIHLIAHPVDLFQEVWDTLHRGEISALEKIDVHPHDIDNILTGPYLGTLRRGGLNLGLQHSPTPCNSLCPLVCWIVEGRDKKHAHQNGNCQKDSNHITDRQHEITLPPLSAVNDRSVRTP